MASHAQGECPERATGGSESKGCPKRLYEADTPLATLGIAAHFAAGGVILVLGGIQLVARLRHRSPAFHRWTGRLYVTAAFIAGLGGLTFIAVKGTIYGFWMMLTGGLGHAPGFRGPLDRVMAFFFYLPNLAVAELFIRGRSPSVSPATRVGISVVLLAVTRFLVLGTYYFTTM